MTDTDTPIQTLQPLMDVLQKASAYLTKHGCPQPRLEAEHLLAHVIKCKRLQLYLNYDSPLTTAELNRYRELIQQRAKRIPLAYLLEECEFWGLPLRINRHALIPSPDTETLIEATLKAIASWRVEHAHQRLLIVELGVGCAPLPLAVCHEVENLCWLGLEKSPQALVLGRQNLQQHANLLTPKQNDVLLVEGDRFAALNPRLRPHLIVSNPPYIASRTLALLQPEVSEYEPHLALDGGRSGDVFHRYLLDWGLTHLQARGRVLMEMGAEQGTLLCDYAKSQKKDNGQPGWESTSIHQDLGNRPRVFEAQKAGNP